VSGVQYTDREHVDADLTRWIEGSNECEQIAARMLKAQVPLLKEIIESGNLAYISGFVRGVSNIAAAMVISLPPFMREGIAESLKSDLNRALNIAVKGPPRSVK